MWRRFCQLTLTLWSRHYLSEDLSQCMSDMPGSHGRGLCTRCRSDLTGSLTTPAWQTLFCLKMRRRLPSRQFLPLLLQNDSYPGYHCWWMYYTHPRSEWSHHFRLLPAYGQNPERSGSSSEGHLPVLVQWCGRRLSEGSRRS